jgi:hypothetical protein
MIGISFALARLALRVARAVSGSGGASPALDFSDAGNSQYSPLMF